MLSKKIDIGHKQHEEVELRWERGFTNVRLFFDNREIGSFTGREELYRGKSFLLYGDDTLFIGFSLKHNAFIIKRNGVYVNASPYHPRYHLAPFIWVSFVMGLIYVICAGIGLSNVLGQNQYSYATRYYVYLGYFCVTGIAFMSIPFLLRAGMFNWIYILQGLIAILITWHIWILYTFGFSSHPFEDLLLMFFILLPALIVGVMILVFKKLVRELGSERARRLNFDKLIS